MTRRILTYLLLSLMAIVASSQDTTAVSTGRHITPVQPSTNVVKQPGKDVSPELIEQYISGDTLQPSARRAKTPSGAAIHATP